jgi:hypothetical protein
MSQASPGAPPALLIEAFTEKNGAGNGAAVVWLQEPAPESWMQALAGSLRQSETAFLLRLGDDWILRWFTPTTMASLFQDNGFRIVSCQPRIFPHQAESLVLEHIRALATCLGADP